MHRESRVGAHEIAYTHSSALHEDGVVTARTQHTNPSALSGSVQLGRLVQRKSLGVDMLASQNAVNLRRIPERLVCLSRMRHILRRRPDKVREGWSSRRAESRARHRRI